MRSTAVAGLVAAALVAVAVAALAVGGLGGIAGGPDGDASAVDAPAAPILEDDAASVVPARLRAGTGLAQVPVVDALPAAAVLQLRVTGFEPFQSGVAHQCHEVAGARRCGNGLSVQFDGRGIASFQYLVHEDTGRSDGVAGGCGVADPPCLVTVTSVDGRSHAELRTVFGGRLPPPAAVEPRDDLPAEGEMSPGADYDRVRLGTGLGVAALLGALGVWLVRRTDWSPVGGAAAPELDDADYADLDAIVAALPDEDAAAEDHR